MRITKTPEERKAELMDAAEKLFLEKGYEFTQVSHIVKEVNVAQGTFYYYFKSKDDILYAIMEKHLNIFYSNVRIIVENPEQDAEMKMKKMFAAFFKPDYKDYWVMQQISRMTGIEVHEKLDEVRISIFRPLFREVVRQGIRDGLFQKIDHPDEITEIIFLGINRFMHLNSRNMTDPDFQSKAIGALSQLMGIVLGLEGGYFEF